MLNTWKNITSSLYVFLSKRIARVVQYRQCPMIANPHVAMRDHRSIDFAKSPYAYNFDHQSLYYALQSPCNSDYFNKILFLLEHPCTSPKFARVGYVTNFKNFIHQKLVWLWSPVSMWLKLFQWSNESMNFSMTLPLFAQIKKNRHCLPNKQARQVNLIPPTIEFAYFSILLDNIITILMFLVSPLLSPKLRSPRLCFYC